jgi:hypothetical protein
MDYVIGALIIIAAVIVGLIPPTAVCKLLCSFTGIASPSIKKTVVVIITGLLISTFFEMIVRKFVILSGATSIIIFCMSLLIVFTLLWQATIKANRYEAILLAGVLMIVILIYTITVPPQFNAYAIIRAAVWWLISHF